MNWDDTGFLVSKTKYNENSVIAEIYTEYHGKCSGIIFGASSKRIKNYLEIGNLLNVNYNIKNVARIGYFKVEICKPYSPLYFDNNKKLLCIASAMNLIKLLTAESQENIKIFFLIQNFFEILTKDKWIKEYIFWELELLKLIGYDLELKKMVDIEKENDQIKYYVKSNTEKKNVPNFLIDNSDQELDYRELLSGLKLVGDYLEKSILRPNNINFPASRVDFFNILK